VNVNNGKVFRGIKPASYDSRLNTLDSGSDEYIGEQHDTIVGGVEYEVINRRPLKVIFRK